MEFIGPLEFLAELYSALGESEKALAIRFRLEQIERLESEAPGEGEFGI